MATVYPQNQVLPGGMIIGDTSIIVLSSSLKGRLVFGTRTEGWYMVDPDNRDYHTAITPAVFAKIGEPASRARYLSPSLLIG